MVLFSGNLFPLNNTRDDGELNKAFDASPSLKLDLFVIPATIYTLP